MGEVVLTANHKGWIVVKKMSTNDNTRDEEVAQGLASADATINRKAFDFCHINMGMIDAYAEKLAKGKRKTFGNLAEALTTVKPGEMKEELIKACPDPKVYPIAEIYFLKALLGALGFKASLDAVTIGEVWPDLKVAKPRGNFKKKA